MIFLYVVAIAACLLFYALYLQLARAEWSDREIREMERMELHVGQIARLLDAPDVRLLMERKAARKRLFLEFSEDLRKDLWKLVRVGLSPIGVLYASLFYASYFFMRVKARLFCSKNDLRFLAGIAWKVSTNATQ